MNDREKYINAMFARFTRECKENCRCIPNTKLCRFNIVFTGDCSLLKKQKEKIKGDFIK